MRDRLSSLLVETSAADARFLVLTGDHGYALFDAFRRAAPERFFNAGVCEQAMVGYAAGLAKQGFRPIVYGLAAFVPLRVVEFIKMDVCYEELPVLFLGDGAGLVYNTLGASHQCAEDVAVLRAVPNITVYSPADAAELSACFAHARAADRPAYIRIGKSDRPAVHGATPSLATPLLPLVRREARVAFVGTGSMASAAMTLAGRFAGAAFSAPRLNGLDPRELSAQLEAFDLVVSIEEHSVNGGLGSMLAESLTSPGCRPKPVLRLGLQNRFTERAGSYDYALREHGLSDDALAASVTAHLPRGLDR